QALCQPPLQRTEASQEFQYHSPLSGSSHQGVVRYALGIGRRRLSDTCRGQVVHGGPISLTRKPLLSRWATSEVRGCPNDESTGIFPRLGDHLRTGRSFSYSTPCLPLAGLSSLARDSHGAFDRRLRRRCRDVLLGVLAPFVMARSALPGHDGMDRQQVRLGEVLRGN